MIAGMALTNRMQASRVLKDTSSFRTEDSEAIVLSNSRWFRPVDTRVGPDGAVYIADWFDIRLSHLSPARQLGQVQRPDLSPQSEGCKTHPALRSVQAHQQAAHRNALAPERMVP